MSKSGGLIVVLLVGAISIAGCSGPDEVPDILLLTVDTLRPDYLSFNGYPLPTTPRLDVLLSEGWYFDEAVTPIARTTPALASLFTGAYPHTTGVRTLTSDLDPSAHTLAEALRSLGYQTLAIPTSFVLPRRRGLDQGFDHYEGVRGLDPAAVVTEAAIREIGNFEDDRPIFAWVHYVDPHNPYESSAELSEIFDPGYEGPYKDRFALQDLVLEKAGEPAGERRTPEEIQQLHEIRATVIHRSDLSEPIKEHARRLYAADIRRFDDQMGALVDAMRARRNGNLIIVFTSDHGESLGEHSFYWDHGDYVYQAGTRVPLAFILPPQHPLHGAGRCGARVSLVDVVPTLFELLGQPLPKGMRATVEGRSLVPCMQGRALPDEPLFAETGRSLSNSLLTRLVSNTIEGRQRSVVIGDWKLIWTPFQEPELEWELYDLRNDPDETRNLYAPDHPRVRELKGALRKWMSREPGDERLPAIEEEDLEGLRALGYVQ